jgi:hypothetical protein
MMRRRWLAGAILAVGWAIAIAVYVSAARVEDDPDVYDLEHSRTYVRQLEVIGGKAAVMGKEIDDWIAGLWRGAHRAYTIACGTALVALAVYLLVPADEPRAPGPRRHPDS